MSENMSFEELMLQAGVAAPSVASPAVAVATPEPLTSPLNIPAPAQQLDYFMAVFRGFYYKPNGKHNEDKPFEIEVKIPSAWLRRTEYIPEGFFRAFLAKRVMPAKYEDFNGIKTVQLISTSGLPANITEKSFLNWTADMQVLEQFITMRNLPVKVELYATPQELRRAIFRCIQCISESGKGGGIDVFLKEQEKRTLGKNKVKREVEAELKAIGY